MVSKFPGFWYILRKVIQNAQEINIFFFYPRQIVKKILAISYWKFLWANPHPKVVKKSTIAAISQWNDFPYHNIRSLKLAWRHVAFSKKLQVMRHFRPILFFFSILFPHAIKVYFLRQGTICIWQQVFLHILKPLGDDKRICLPHPKYVLRGHT